MAYSFKRGLSLSERIAKNVQDLLEFQQGSVPYDREMGVSTMWRDKERRLYTAQTLTEAEDMVNMRETRAHTELNLIDGEIYAAITEATDD